MSKLIKTTTRVEMVVPFQGATFLACLFGSIVIAALGYALMSVPKIGAAGLLMVAVAYFTPTFLAFDLFQTYNKNLSNSKLDSE